MKHFNPYLSVKVKGYNDKSLDKAISLLRKKMAKEGIFVEMKRRSHFVKPSEIYRLKKKEQIRRHQLKNKKK